MEKELNEEEKENSRNEKDDIEIYSQETPIIIKTKSRVKPEELIQTTNEEMKTQFMNEILYLKEEISSIKSNKNEKSIEEGSPCNNNNKNNNMNNIILKLNNKISLLQKDNFFLKNELNNKQKIIDEFVSYRIVQSKYNKIKYTT